MMSQSKSDQTLLLEFSLGNRDSLTEFYCRHMDKLRLYLRGLCGNDDLALEIAQDLFSDLCKNPKPFASAKNPRAYFFGSAHKKMQMALRKNFQQENTNQLRLLQRATPSSGKDDLELELKISEALFYLPEDEKEAVLLHGFAEFSFNEMEGMLQTPADTLYRRYKRALEKLKTKLKDYE